MFIEAIVLVFVHMLQVYADMRTFALAIFAYLCAFQGK